MPYCTNADLVSVRPNILSYGVADWSSKITEAEEYINKILIVRWYRPAARTLGLDPYVTEFDQTRVTTTELKKAAVYKTLELAYMHLMKEGPEEDGFERNMNAFAKEFQKELDLALSVGLKYDWDAGGSAGDNLAIRSTRRLVRG